jgi:hypothetical protein
MRLGKGVRREAGLKRAYDKIADAAYRKRIEAFRAWVTRQRDGYAR